MSGERVELRIDELVLEGAGPGDADRIAAAMRGELARLLGEHGVPAALRREGGIGALDLGMVTPPPGAGAEGIGTQIGQAVYGGMVR